MPQLACFVSTPRSRHGRDNNMADSNEDLDERAELAAAEIRRERTAGERVNVAAIARQHRVDRKSVFSTIKGHRRSFIDKAD
jgi:hypothetical protein